MINSRLSAILIFGSSILLTDYNVSPYVTLFLNQSSHSITVIHIVMDIIIKI